MIIKRGSTGHVVEECENWIFQLCLFFEHEYDGLNDNEKYQFIRLLECADPDLFNWLMNHGRPDDDEIYHMIKLIQQRNKDRGPVEI